MFNNLLISAYLKNLTIEKAILIAKQFNINYSKEEMNLVLPFLKNNYVSFFNEQKKNYLLDNLRNNSNETIYLKTKEFINKVLVIFS